MLKPPVEGLAASGPKATERGAEEEACEGNEAGGRSRHLHHDKNKPVLKSTGLLLL